MGVDHSFGKTYNSDNTTDHFLVIVGCGCDTKGSYYLFYEVGTYEVNKETKGVHDNNRLYVLKNNFVQGYTNTSDRLYTLTQIRTNK